MPKRKQVKEEDVEEEQDEQLTGASGSPSDSDSDDEFPSGADSDEESRWVLLHVAPAVRRQHVAMHACVCSSSGGSWRPRPAQHAHTTSSTARNAAPMTRTARPLTRWTSTLSSTTRPRRTSMG